MPEESEVIPKAPDEIKDGKKKLVLVLEALAAIGIGTVLIAADKKIPSKIDIKKFKKLGKFDKGVATVEGKPYTVAIKNGVNTMKYENGKLQSAFFIKSNGSGKNMTASAVEKVYSYNNNGKLKGVRQYTYYTANNGICEFALDAILKNLDSISKNLIKVESGVLEIEPGKITASKALSNLDSIKTKITLLKQDGTLDDKIIYTQKLNKDKVIEKLQDKTKK